MVLKAVKEMSESVIWKSWGKRFWFNLCVFISFPGKFVSRAYIK